MELIEALNGRQGDLDAWLEAHSEADVREAIKALISPEETLRDKFAAKAMQAMLSSTETLLRMSEAAGRELISPEVMIATASYRMSDAMLAERNK